jgi:ABC-type nitrate/sulfonate/bicarbonate transport system ATPase subunit
MLYAPGDFFGIMLFDLRNIEYTFAARYPALRGIDMKIEAGVRLVVLGANGCGKSTLLHILAGLPTSCPAARKRGWPSLRSCR